MTTNNIYCQRLINRGWSSPTKRTESIDNLAPGRGMQKCPQVLEKKISKVLCLSKKQVNFSDHIKDV